MPTLQTLLPAEIFSYLLVFSRIGTTISVLPGFGESYVSPRIRLLLALTITLPEDLARAADRVVREGKARSRNDLLVTALRHELAARERAAIDAAFAVLAGDHAFQRESTDLAEEGTAAGWDALRLAEASG